MNTLLWVCQVLLAFVFLYSGGMKSTQSEARLVAIGQTGVEGLPMSLIRFIGLAELMGVIGLTVPTWSGVLPVVTPIAALCLGLIMPPAAVIHYRRNEMLPVALNMFILLLCLFVAYGRRSV